jgi:hypothetical protein
MPFKNLFSAFFLQLHTHIHTHTHTHTHTQVELAPEEVQLIINSLAYDMKIEEVRNGVLGAVYVSVCVCVCIYVYTTLKK